MDLHRASNISYGEAKTSTELAAGLVSTPCRPGRSKHSCSVQLSLNAGSLNSGTSQKEHVSRKICQTLRRKLSIISKLRAKLQGAGCARSEHMNSNGPSVSYHREIIRTPVVTFPTSHELGGSYYFPANRDLAAYKGPLHVSQAELPVDSVHELSCMHNGSVAKISEKPDSRQMGYPKHVYHHYPLLRHLSSRYYHRSGTAQARTDKHLGRSRNPPLHLDSRQKPHCLRQTGVVGSSSTVPAMTTSFHQKNL